MSASDVLPRRRAARLVALAFAAIGVLAPTACQLGDGSCLRMSDCDPDYTCVEGTCRSDKPEGTLLPEAGDDSGSSKTRKPGSDASASGDASRDASVTDGAPTDATPDA